jgi:hypothetical protein
VEVERAPGGAAPALLALVDVSAGPEFAALAAGALAAALEALPPGGRFGVAAFGGGGIALLEPPRAAGAPPRAHHVRLTGAGAEEPAAAPLADALPPAHFFAEIGERGGGAAAAAACLDALPELAAAAPGAPRERPLGEALQALLRYAGAAAAGGAPLAGARLLVLLGGPPNAGRGAVVRTRPPPRPRRRAPTAEDAMAWSASGLGSDILFATPLPPPPPRAPPPPEASARGALEAAADLAPAAAELGLAAPAAAWGDDGGGAAPRAALELRWEAAAFYAEAGAAAAALGVAVDVVAASATFVGLELLRPLAAASGGAAALFPDPHADGCALAQDLYKRAAEPRALRCLLRLRASPELRVVGPLGARLARDAAAGDLFCLPAAGPGDALCLELEHARASGFATRATPVLQAVLQYSRFAPAPPAAPGGAPRFALERRVRVVTAAFDLADSAAALYAALDEPALAAALAQGLAAAAAADGPAAAQLALREWLAQLAADHAEWAAAGEFGGGGGGAASPAHSPRTPTGGRAATPVDAALAGAGALTAVPRLAFSLLRSAPLGGAAGGPRPAHPDAAAATAALWEALPPGELLLAAHPQLSSWASPDAPAAARHPLARAAFRAAPARLWLLDAYDELVIFYSAGAGLKPPPPPGSALRAHLDAARAGRARTPRVAFAVEGYGGGATLARWLLEDGGYAEFLERVARDAAALLEG